MPIIIGIILLVVIIALIVMAVSWIFSNFLGVFGIAGAIAGLYYVGKYAREGKKSKVPGILIVLGVLLAFGWFTLSGDDNDVAKTKETTGQVSGVVSEKENKDPSVEEVEKEQVAKEEAEKKEKEESEKKAVEEEKARQEAEAKAKAEEEVKKQQEEVAASLALEAVTVSRVVDGDTVELSDGRKIRLIGVNTPESTTRTEEYGKEASNYTKSKLEGKQVWLQKDVSDTDRYQRYLRIIWLAVPSDDMNESEIRSKMFNADLVLNGYAEPSTYPPDVKYSEYFVKFAREAREKNTGLWAFGENGTTKGDLDPKETAKTNTNTNKTTISAPAPKPKATTPAPPPQPATSSACNIKGNQSGIYHVPGGAYYDRTNAEEMFCSEEEAQAAGYRKSKR